MNLKYHEKHLKCTCLISAVCGLFACADDPQISLDSEIVISPAVRDLVGSELHDAHGRCLFNEDFYQDTPIQIVLKTAAGAPIGNADLRVFADFAGNTFAGLNAMALYEDSNSNGVVDSADRLVSGVGDDIYSVKTDEHNGSVHILLRVNLSCSFKGRVFAFSGPISGAMEVHVASGRAK